MSNRNNETFGLSVEQMALLQDLNIASPEHLYALLHVPGEAPLIRRLLKMDDVALNDLKGALVKAIPIERRAQLTHYEDPSVRLGVIPDVAETESDPANEASIENEEENDTKG